MTTHVAGLTMHRKFSHGEDLLQQADICRGLAGIARTERNRLFWLRLAGEWAELAGAADRQQKPPRPAGSQSFLIAARTAE